MRLQLLALTTLLAFAVGGLAKASVRIMPIGDSITAGVTDATAWTIPFTFSYRGPLYTMLTDAGYDFEFVGASGEPWVYPASFGQPTVIQGPDLRTVGQDGHRGYAGASVHDILAGGIVNGINNPIPNIVTALNADDPDIVLLMIGTNGFDPGGELDPLVNTIVSTKPNAQLIIAQIPPRVSNAAATLNYNNYIKNTLVPKYQSLGKNVTTVDQYPNFMNPNGTVNASLFETDYGTHIVPAGNELMAQTWFDGIMALSGVDPDPDPRTVVTGTYTVGNTPPTLPANNLIVQGSDTFNDSFSGGSISATANWSSTLPDAMNNGVMTDANAMPILAWDGVTDDFGWAIYQLDTTINTLGYDVSEILSYAGWIGARVNQAVEIKYALVGETITEGEELGHTLGSFYYSPSNNSTPYAYTTMSIANNDDSTMLSGIAAIEVKYIDNLFNGGNGHVGEAGNYSAYKQFAVIGTPTLPTVEDIPGDANRDGKVDGSDVTILAGNWQVLENTGWDMGDFNGDGKVDGSDVTILAGNWQAGVDTAAASVPEPSMIILLMTITLGVVLARHKF